MLYKFIIYLCSQEDPGVACGAIGLCQSQQAAMAKVEVRQQEQLMSNEIPQIDLSHRVAPFLLNVPQLLYPQEKPKQEAAQVHNIHLHLTNFF